MLDDPENCLELLNFAYAMTGVLSVFWIIAN